MMPNGVETESRPEPGSAEYWRREHDSALRANKALHKQLLEAQVAAQRPSTPAPAERLREIAESLMPLVERTGHPVEVAWEQEFGPEFRVRYEVRVGR